MERIQFADLPEDVRESLEMLNIPGYDEAESISALRQVAAQYPGFAPARLNLAAMLLESDDTEAERTYRDVLSDFPEENGAIGGLATVHAARKDYENAESLARQALDNGYDWPPLFEVIAEARENAGDIQAASEAYLESYRRSPHSWNCLEHYCRLNNRPFTSPLDAVESPTDTDTLKTLFEFIDVTANTPDENGDAPGCDHTFRFTEQWANQNNVDVIDLYQFLNAYGGFCDCEVCFNVEAEFFDEECEDE